MVEYSCRVSVKSNTLQGECEFINIFLCLYPCGALPSTNECQEFLLINGLILRSGRITENRCCMNVYPITPTF